MIPPIKPDLILHQEFHQEDHRKTYQQEIDQNDLIDKCLSLEGNFHFHQTIEKFSFENTASCSASSSSADRTTSLHISSSSALILSFLKILMPNQISSYIHYFQS